MRLAAILEVWGDVRDAGGSNLLVEKWIMGVGCVVEAVGVEATAGIHEEENTTTKKNNQEKEELGPFFGFLLFLLFFLF